MANCPIAQNDIPNAYAIFGGNLTGIQGKTVWQKPERVETDYVQIPKEFMTTHKFVTLMADIMFVNNLAYVITFRRGIGHLIMEFTPVCRAKQLAHNLIKVVQLYSWAGFVVQTILMDMEFNKVIPELQGRVVNASAAKEHVAEIEQLMRVVKE